MMRWQRDFLAGLGFLGGVVLSIFVWYPMAAGLALMSGFLIAKSAYQEDSIVKERKQE